MSKFEEGDIIVKDGYTYVCRIVGETEAYFEHRWFKGLFKNPENPENAWGDSGCGDGEDFSCNKKLVLYSDKSKFIKNRENKNMNACGDYQYPVIGKHINCKADSFYLRVIQYNYPEVYRQYIEYLYNKLSKLKTIEDTANIIVEKEDIKIKKSKSKK